MTDLCWSEVSELQTMGAEKEWPLCGRDVSKWWVWGSEVYLFESRGSKVGSKYWHISSYRTKKRLKVFKFTNCMILTRFWAYFGFLKHTSGENKAKETLEFGLELADFRDLVNELFNFIYQSQNRDEKIQIIYFGIPWIKISICVDFFG